MRKFDCLILEGFAGAVAGDVVNGSGVLSARGKYFHITRVLAGASCLFQFETEGESIDAQGNGVYVPEVDLGSSGRIVLDVPFVVAGAASFNWTVTVENDFPANAIGVALPGYWTQK